jgi:RecB family exonuclease
MRVKMTHYLALGNAVHLALEKAYTKVGDDNFFTLTASVEQTAKLFLDDFNRSIAEDDIFVTYPQLKKAQADGQEMVVRYFNQAEEGLIDPNPIGVETEFKLPISGINIVGKIDKIERHPEGLVVIDYKSGGKKPVDWMLRRNLQFSAYAWACRELYGEYPYKVVWHHLRTGERLESERTGWDIDQLKRIVSAAVQMQDMDLRYRIYHDKVCGQCDFAGPTCDDQELEAQVLSRRV